MIRDQRVMFDRDLAELYKVTTGNLNKAVARNIKRFPGFFMFQLSEEEFRNLIFQNGISSWGGTRKPPYAISEQGVAMLSGMLDSGIAISVHIQITRIFTRVREMQNNNAEIRLEIEKIKNKLDNQDENLEVVLHCLDELLKKKEKLTPPRKAIGSRIKSIR